jgi:hypothetical protein
MTQCSPKLLNLFSLLSKSQIELCCLSLCDFSPARQLPYEIIGGGAVIGLPLAWEFHSMRASIQRCHDRSVAGLLLVNRIFAGCSTLIFPQISQQVRKTRNPNVISTETGRIGEICDQFTNVVAISSGREPRITDVDLREHPEKSKLRHEAGSIGKVVIRNIQRCTTDPANKNSEVFATNE